MEAQQLLAEDRLDPELLKDRVLGHDPLHTDRRIPGRRRVRHGGKTSAPGSQPEASEAPALHALLAGQGLPAGSGLAPGRRDELLRQFYGQLDVVKAALGGAA